MARKTHYCCIFIQKCATKIINQTHVMSAHKAKASLFLHQIVSVYLSVQAIISSRLHMDKCRDDIGLS